MTELKVGSYYKDLSDFDEEYCILKIIREDAEFYYFEIVEARCSWDYTENRVLKQSNLWKKLIELKAYGTKLWEVINN